MASWGEKLSQMTHNAVSKSKELAEITKLNLEISNAEDEIKDATAYIGKYVHENNLCTDIEEIAKKCVHIGILNETIKTNNERITAIRNINVCAACNAEVSRTSKFCDKCGAPMQREQDLLEANVKKCVQCNEEIEKSTVFCGNCGAKN